MSQLLLIRHGQAMFGHDNYDALSPLGQQQAAATGAFLRQRDYRFSHLYCGPRVRQQLTLDGILEQYNPDLKPAVNITEALDEFADGRQVLDAARKQTLAAGQSWSDDRQQQLRCYVKTLHHWAQGKIEIEDCVSAQIFQNTVDDWLATLMQQHHGDEQILAVTSAGTIAAILCHVLKLPIAQMADFTVNMYNTGLTQLRLRETSIAVQTINSPFHLPSQWVTQI